MIHKGAKIDRGERLDKLSKSVNELKLKILNSNLEDKTLNIHLPNYELDKINTQIQNLIKNIGDLAWKARNKK